MSDVMLKLPFTQDQLKSLKLKTGDIILFSCDWVIGQAIKLTGGKFTHSAMVIIEDDAIKCFESAINKFGNGVHLVPMEEVLADSLKTQQPAEFAIRPLRQELNTAQSQQLLEFIKKFEGVFYEINLLELLKAGLIGPEAPDEKAIINNVVGNPELKKHFTGNFEETLNKILSSIIKKTYNKVYKDEALRTVFCSEIVVAALKHIELLKTDVASSNFTPDDLSTRSRFSELKDNEIYMPEYTFWNNEVKAQPAILYKAERVEEQIAVTEEPNTVVKKKNQGCKCAIM